MIYWRKLAVHFYKKIVRLIMSPPTASIIDKILAEFAKPDAVKIRNSAKVSEKVEMLITHGSKALQIITDFDATLTRYHLNGQKCDSSYGIIANTPLVSADYREGATKLYLKYYPIEIDPNMSIEDKIPHMVEWYEKSHEYMVTSEPKIKKSSIKEMVLLSRSFLRDNAKKMVERLADENVPVLVLSAGVGDVVEEVLLHNQIKLPNVKVISNFMEFDESDHVSGFKDPLIHMYNKNEAALHDDNTQYFKDLKERHNVILMGDSLGDANMDHGVSNSESVLKIGFLNVQANEHLDVFMSAYDIVLLDDQSMDFVNLILNKILKPST